MRSSFTIVRVLVWPNQVSWVAAKNAPYDVPVDGDDFLCGFCGFFCEFCGQAGSKSRSLTDQ